MNNIVFSNERSAWVPHFAKPVCCVLQLEHSSKWPNDLEALRHLKTSFYLKIADKLASDYKIASHVTPDYLELFHEGK